jgi:BirA family biotin operon repressor/biotin-[acetyl-CoA-carboxylase] ligase
MNGQSGELDYPTLIRTNRKTRWLGTPLQYFASVTSTNDVLAESAREGAQAGALVVADFQSQGKGRLGRRWLAPPGTSLLFSLLLRPKWPPERTTWLTMMAGVATVEAIASLSGLSPKLKWPNDLMLPADGQWLKVGGMLLEGSVAGGHLEAAILGIGINVNIRPEHIPAARWPATSLLRETGRVIDRAALLNDLLLRLEKHYEAADDGGSPWPAWERKLVTIGQKVTFSQDDNRQPLSGVAVRTDEWGRLVVREQNGHEHLISAGDVTLRVDNSGD